MTCLSIVQKVCLRVGLDSPSSAVGSTERQTLQILELSNEAGQELSRRYPWQALLGVANFTTVATEVQDTLTDIVPSIDYIINDTIWNRTLRRPVFGPKTPQNWEQQKAFAINGPWSGYRIIGGELAMYPIPTAGQDCYFEYISKNWVTTSTASTSPYWTNDADAAKIDENLIILDTIWRWKQQRGLDYAEDFAKSERLYQDLANRDGGKDWLNLSNTKYDIFPGVIVPAGSWNL